MKQAFLTNKESSDKILSNKKVFYYLQYTLGSAGKYVLVGHSLTSEISYTDFAALLYNLKSGDLKDIRKAVEKSSD